MSEFERIGRYGQRVRVVPNRCGPVLPWSGPPSPCPPDSVRVEPRGRLRRVAARRQLRPGAARQHLLHRGLLRRRDPQFVLLLHGDLVGDICAAVRRDAAVSTWFIYNQPRVHQAVQDGIAAQRDHVRQESPVPDARHVSAAGLRTDLALAREEIKDLKKERDRLRDRLRLSLGAELDEVNRNELIQRVQQLDERNTALNQELSAAKVQIAALEGRLREAEDDLTAARTGLRRAMRAVPSP